MDAVSMGTLIRQLREAAGMTQAQLGERLGLRKDQMSRAEHGCGGWTPPEGRWAGRSTR